MTILPQVRQVTTANLTLPAFHDVMTCTLADRREAVHLLIYDARGCVYATDKRAEWASDITLCVTQIAFSYQYNNTKRMAFEYHNNRHPIGIDVGRER